MEKEENEKKIDGVSAVTNLVPGSEHHKRFARLIKEAGMSSNRDFVVMLMDTYENPPQDADSAATIINLENMVNGQKAELSSYEATLQNKDLEIADLKKQLEEAQKMANDNAVNGLGKQAQIEDLQKQLEGAIIVKLNPCYTFFMNEICKESGMKPDEILRKIFIEDLQNPKSNNFPHKANGSEYTVSSSRIREVMEQLKPKP